jgi:hypothetical protein
MLFDGTYTDFFVFWPSLMCKLSVTMEESSSLGYHMLVKCMNLKSAFHRTNSRSDHQSHQIHYKRHQHSHATTAGKRFLLRFSGCNASTSSPTGIDGFN